MGFKEYLIYFSTLAVAVHHSHGCEMDGVTNWLLPQQLSILDVFEGEFFIANTTSIAGISSTVINQALNRGPYFDFVQSGSEFSIRTNAEYPDYEEYETETAISITVLFNCDGSTLRSMVFIISIEDTNNNDPLFRPTNELEFTVVPPLPPGFQITGCWNDIYARDIDLTTQRVDYEIFDSPYFEIAYDQASSTVPKEFKATLKTTTFIRSIPEPIVFRISATDVDLTNDDRRTTYATITIKGDGEFELPEEPVFSQTFYLGTYTEDHRVILQDTIALRQGYHDEVEFSLEQDYQPYFELVRDTNQVSIEVINPLPADQLLQNQIIIVINAERNLTSGASTAVILKLPEEEVLQFQQPSYQGSIIDNVLHLSEMFLTQGYTDDSVAVEIISEHSQYFTYTVQHNIVTLWMESLPSAVLEQNNLLNLQVVASNSRTSTMTIVTLEIVKDDGVTPVFQHNLYEGTYNLQEGLRLDEIVLLQGYGVTVHVELQGEHSALFGVTENRPRFYLTVSSIPTELFREGSLLLTLVATKPRTVGASTVISIALPADDSSGLFDKVLYEGRIQNGIVQHATITISEYEGTNIELIGVYESLFNASLSDGIVVVQAQDPLTLPPDTHHVVLELRAASSSAVLVLEVLTTEGPVVPTVTFGSLSYAIRVEVGQTGLMGQVQATADNGESITYSLLIDNDHLRTRVSVNSAGELWLSAPANSGVYSFQTVATTVFSQATGYATIHMSVEAITVCGNEIVTPPLIVIDRDEEEPLRDLVVLNAAEHVGCQYTLTNKWPITQNWLYVDETGLHATAIDREDPSIAFMALSQVQVELVLTCDSDVTRTKRSIDGRLDWLGPYDYGTNTWLLGQTIQFNSRRSIVNLIVNDINDNTPIFIGKENEPIVVGYPVPELEATILPRSLAELQATDADVGINAALVYWSSEPELAVSPTTGFVHVTNDQRLEHDKILTVNATDLNGQGLTGSISLMVKLLDSSNVAVVTVSGAFLEDENNVLGNISNSIGYEVRSLRSVVVSDTEEELSLRMNRNTTTPTASLEIYVYGLVQAVAVSAERLKTDINNAEVVAVSIANIQSLEDHLDSRLTCDEPGRDVGLLAATIVLSILLFILIVAIVVWFILTRTRKQNYDQFSDANSLASRNESLDQPKPLDSIAVTKPRLNIEELKRSEKRLQDMLNAPIEPEASTSNNETGINSVAKANLPDPIAPIVIQDKLKDAVEESDDDEFGERRKPRRKSVVTFNENVEKIIHVNEEPDGIADSNYEVYKL